jgi:hypothetical protein
LPSSADLGTGKRSLAFVSLGQTWQCPPSGMTSITRIPGEKR